jgi:hypothetical protein
LCFLPHQPGDHLFRQRIRQSKRHKVS